MTRILKKFNLIKQLIIIQIILATSTGFSLENLNLKSNYKVKVKYITPYGTQGESNTLTTNLIDLTTKLSLKADPNNFSIDLSWTLINSSAIRAYSVQYVMNNSLTYAHYIGIFVYLKNN